jgi:hypothetical protein
MFGRGKIREGNHVFVVQNHDRFTKLIIGRVYSVHGSIIHVSGSTIIPIGLIARVSSGRGEGRPKEVLFNPDPNNCIFMLIDNVEFSNFDGEIDQNLCKVTWINENRYNVLDGWIKENLPDMFANFFKASTNEDRTHARFILLEKMNSIYERDLKEHVYAVVRSTKIL